MLELRAITQQFGGVTALEDVSFSANQGEILGVIGPNGAGKTTLFNIVTGIYVQTHGEIILKGRDISRLPAESLAKNGLVRTFQNIELFGSLSVIDNVKVGLHTKSCCGMISSMLKLPWQIAEERRITQECHEFLAFCGINDIADQKASNLPFGKGRFLELARAMASHPEIILMDEPAAGLNNRETRELASLIRKVRDKGITVVLVEHDMELVMDICDRIVVLNLGRKLAEGTPREIQENPDVISAYLGEG